MKFYTKTHQRYCGIDLHTKNLYVCIIDPDHIGAESNFNLATDKGNGADGK